MPFYKKLKQPHKFKLIFKLLIKKKTNIFLKNKPNLKKEIKDKMKNLNMKTLCPTIKNKKNGAILQNKIDYLIRNIK